MSATRAGRRRTSTPSDPAELVEARRWGFIKVKANRRGTELINEWWHECCRQRRPYLVVTVRGSKNADLRLEMEPMDPPYPEPVTCFTDDQKSELCDLVRVNLNRAGSVSIYPDGGAASGVVREGVEMLAVRMLAIVATLALTPK